MGRWVIIGILDLAFFFRKEKKMGAAEGFVSYILRR